MLIHGDAAPRTAVRPLPGIAGGKRSRLRASSLARRTRAGLRAAAGAQLGEGVALDLADPLAGQAEVPADLVERPRPAVVQAEAHPEDPRLPLGQRRPAPRRARPELLPLHGSRRATRVVGTRSPRTAAVVADGASSDTGVAAERRISATRGGHRGRLGDLLGERSRPSAWVSSRWVRVTLDSSARCTGRRTVRPCSAIAAPDRLADPPGRVGGELVALGVVELLDGADQAEVALLDDVQQRQPAVRRSFLATRHDQPQVGAHHVRFARGAVLGDQRQVGRRMRGRHPLAGGVPAEQLGGEQAGLDPLGELDLLGGGEQRGRGRSRPGRPGPGRPGGGSSSASGLSSSGTTVAAVAVAVVVASATGSSSSCGTTVAGSTGASVGAAASSAALREAGRRGLAGAAVIAGSPAAGSTAGVTASSTTRSGAEVVRTGAFAGASERSMVPERSVLPVRDVASTVRPAGRLALLGRRAGCRTGRRGAALGPGALTGHALVPIDGACLGEAAQHGAGLGRADPGLLEGGAQLLEGEGTLRCAAHAEQRLDDVGGAGSGGQGGSPASGWCDGDPEECTACTVCTTCAHSVSGRGGPRGLGRTCRCAWSGERLTPKACSAPLHP